MDEDSFRLTSTRSPLLISAAMPSSSQNSMGLDVPLHSPSLGLGVTVGSASSLDFSALSEVVTTSAHSVLVMDTLPASSVSPPQASNFQISPMGKLVSTSDVTLQQTSSTNANNIYQAADSNSTKQMFVPCKVCGDRASGYHYGVTSCEGCKGFFRRSIQKQIEYRCLRDGKCMVIRLNRNRCQYCRFKKCLAVGMSRDFHYRDRLGPDLSAVRYGRVPKKAKMLEEKCLEVSATAALDQIAIENKQLEIYDVILNMSQAHHTNCAITEDKVKSMNRCHITLLGKTDFLSDINAETLQTQRLAMWENLAVLITPAIQSVVEFAKRVPAFTELSQDDQLILIKAGFFEIWVTRMARMFNPAESLLTFEDGSMVHKDELSIIYMPEFITSMYDVATGFNTLNLNDTELGLFTGIILVTADRAGLSDTKAVERIQDKLIEALKLQINRNHSTEEHLFATTLMKLPELRTLGTQHSELLHWFRSQWHNTKLPPLFSEIYDIPKSEDDLDG